MCQLELSLLCVPCDRLLVGRLSDSSGHLPARGEPSQDEPVPDAVRSAEAPSCSRSALHLQLDMIKEPAARLGVKSRCNDKSQAGWT